MNAETHQAARAVVLLSGGLDSATALALACRQGFACYALSVWYGQRHAGEIDCAAEIAAAFGACDHKILDLDLRWIGGSALTAPIAVPMDREQDDTIPVTYVPARNTILLSLALGWAEVIGARDIFIGVNAVDYSGYPDCRPEFIAAFERTANLATRMGVEGKAITIHTPLISLSKAEIIKKGIDLGIDYAMTTSCYDPADDGTACGHCDACILRRKGFSEAGIPDPTRYRQE